MGGYVFIITTRTINDYINGCVELFLKIISKLFCGLQYLVIFAVVIINQVLI